MRPLAYIQLLRDAANLWIDRDAFQHASALAFYTLFSLGPLVVIVIAIVGAVYGAEAATGEISAALNNLVGSEAAEAVEEAVIASRPESAGLWPTIISAATLAFGATTVFAQMQTSLNQFWDVRAKPGRSGILNFLMVRLLSLGMVLIIGFLLLISFALSVAITGLLTYTGQWVTVPELVISALDLVLSLLICTLLFGMIFKVLPDVRLQWADVWRSAVVTAILFLLGQHLISLYLTRVAPASAFGAAGSLVLVLFWVYYSSLILFFGTALTKVAILRRDGAVHPKQTAVRVRMEVQEK